MNHYKIKVQKFEGPLDLLIHLIETNKIDIYDIPIVSITKQYIEYLEAMKEFSLEVASEFIVMASTLLQIKSKMLLPKLPTEKEEDPREDLVQMIVEYKKAKAGASILEKRLLLDNSYHEKSPEKIDNVKYEIELESVGLLLKAFLDLRVDYKEVTIEKMEFDIKDKMNNILDLLKISPNGISLRQTLTEKGNKNEFISSFLAILELLKLNLIMISQASKYSEIYIFLRGR